MRRPRIWCSLPGRSPKFWVALLAVALIVPALAAPRALADNDTIMPGDAIPGDAPHGDGPLIPTIPQQVDATVPTWFPATISGTAGRRHGHAGIVDPVSHRYILFGGFRSGDNIRLGDLWSYSFAERSWTQLSSIGGPSPRFGHTAVYDPGNARMVVFGGYDGAPRNDLWLLSLSGAPVWTAVTPPGARPWAAF